jgi:hypothetical protein
LNSLGHGESVGKAPFKPVTDWSATSTASVFGDVDDDHKKADKGNSTWLSDFLGVGGKPAKPDAASLSKLSVTLDKGDTKGR